jgi:hypothetical protein
MKGADAPLLPEDGEPFELVMDFEQLGLDPAKLDAAIEEVARASFALLQEQGTSRTLDEVWAQIREAVYGFSELRQGSRRCPASGRTISTRSAYAMPSTAKPEEAKRTGADEQNRGQGPLMGNEEPRPGQPQAKGREAKEGQSEDEAKGRMVTKPENINQDGPAGQRAKSQQQSGEKRYQDWLEEGWKGLTIKAGESRSREVEYDPATYKLELSDARYGNGGEFLEGGGKDLPEVKVEETGRGAVIVADKTVDHDITCLVRPVGEIRK